MNVLITGDSHVGIFMQTIQKGLWEQIPGIDMEIKAIGPGNHFFSPFFVENDGYAEIIVPKYQRNFRFMPPKERPYDAIGFSGPLHTTRVWRQNWAEHTPWSAPGAGTHRISLSLLETIIDDDVKYILKLLAIIKAKGNVFVIEAPAPFTHHRRIPENGAEKVIFIDRYYRNYVNQKLDELGIPVVTLDPEWLDENGFMQSRFRNDQHHGNVQFGKLMLERVSRFLATNPFGQ